MVAVRGSSSTVRLEGCTAKVFSFLEARCEDHLMVEKEVSKGRLCPRIRLQYSKAQTLQFHHSLVFAEI